MLQAFKDRRDDEQGFTLIELMVVVLIIAILIAIAIPTFLGARQRAQHRSAQSNLRNALTAEKTAYTDSSTYTATSATLSNIEPSLSWVTATPTAGTNQVEVVLGTNAVCLTAQSADNKFYAIMDQSVANGSSNAGTYYTNTEVTSGNCDSKIAANLANNTPQLGGW